MAAPADPWVDLAAAPEDGAHAPGDGEDDLAGWAQPLDWAAFWTADNPEQEWLVEPLIPARRQVAIYSTAKTGKSLLALDVAAGLATGRALLGATRAPPTDVVYLDLEMTGDDIRERLEDMGYGPDSDLSRLHYYLLPSLPSLDTDLGGQVLEAICRRYTAQLVVVDTMARAVTGDENESDTYRDFYRHTGRRLKAAGTALLRLDHQGKDPTAGQRGSSAKCDDVDVVFRLTAVDDGFKLRRTHSRVAWVPPEIDLVRHADPLRHVLATGLWPDGTKEIAQLLDELQVPLDARVADAMRALTGGGQGRRKQVVAAALKWRRRS
ncbi:MAG: AAA family ATPase [Acidimicrobiales bacterium]